MGKSLIPAQAVALRSGLSRSLCLEMSLLGKPGYSRIPKQRNKQRYPEVPERESKDKSKCPESVGPWDQAALLAPSETPEAVASWLSLSSSFYPCGRCASLHCVHHYTVTTKVSSQR